MIKFSEMPYQRPDVEGMKETLKNAAEKAAQAKTYQEVRDAYFEVQEKSIQASTLYSIAHVRNTMDTTDEYYDGELKWLREQLAMLTPLEVAWQKALTTSPFRKDFEAEFGKQLFRMLDADLLTEDERIIPEMIREGELCQEYSKTAAQAKTDFRGEECNFYGLLKHMESTDRQERKDAFEAWAKPIDARGEAPTSTKPTKSLRLMLPGSRVASTRFTMYSRTRSSTYTCFTSWRAARISSFVATACG